MKIIIWAMPAGRCKSVRSVKLKQAIAIAGFWRTIALLIGFIYQIELVNIDGEYSILLKG